jgi:hypothetical protein
LRLIAQNLNTIFKVISDAFAARRGHPPVPPLSRTSEAESV